MGGGRLGGSKKHVEQRDQNSSSKRTIEARVTELSEENLLLLEERVLLQQARVQAEILALGVQNGYSIAKEKTCIVCGLAISLGHQKMHRRGWRTVKKEWWCPECFRNFKKKECAA